MEPYFPILLVGMIIALLDLVGRGNKQRRRDPAQLKAS
jgi:hypothetical protein